VHGDHTVVTTHPAKFNPALLAAVAHVRAATARGSGAADAALAS
jgi:hypothetical protein